MSPITVLINLAAILMGAASGALCAWLTRRFTTLSARNYYPPAATFAAAFALALALRAWDVVFGLAPVCAGALAAATQGRRMRLADLGAGEELRSYEQARRWVWQPAPPRRQGERTYLRSQGELVHRGRGPTTSPYVPMGYIGSRRDAAAARRGSAHLRLRRDRLGQDDDDAPRSRRPHPHPDARRC